MQCSERLLNGCSDMYQLASSYLQALPDGHHSVAVHVDGVQVASLATFRTDTRAPSAWVASARKKSSASACDMDV